MKKKAQNRECDICGGTGQVSFFKGVSRFLLSIEECEERAGTGFHLSFTGDGVDHNREVDKVKKNVKKRKN